MKYVDTTALAREVCLAAGGSYANAVHFLDRVAHDINYSYDRLMGRLAAAAESGNYISLGSNVYSCDGEKLWASYELVTGTRLALRNRSYSPFTCAC